jgi:hypothetical protein
MSENEALFQKLINLSKSAQTLNLIKLLIRGNSYICIYIYVHIRILQQTTLVFEFLVFLNLVPEFSFVS